MTTYRQAVEAAVNWAKGAYKPGTLSRTTFAALAYRTTSDVKVLLFSTAGAKSSGIAGDKLDDLSSHFGILGITDFVVVGAASPIDTQGDWHMNDAERQLLRALSTAEQENSALIPAELGAIGATRAFCAGCQHFVMQNFTHNHQNLLAYN